MADQAVDEQGLLAYNYEASDVNGKIDNSNDIDMNFSFIDSNKTQDTHKESLYAPPVQSKNNNQKQNVNQNNNNNASSAKKPSECSTYMMHIFNWIPIRTLCFVGAAMLFAFPFLDNKFSRQTITEWFLGWYIQAFGILGMFIESPTWYLTKKAQLSIFFYARFLRRTSGRAFFYISIAILTFAEGTSITMIAGIYFFIVALIMMLFSRLAANQLHRMHDYMKYGQSENDGQNVDVDVDEHALAQRFVGYYHGIDFERTRKIGSSNLHKFAEQALKRKLSNSERYTIQCYLDVSCFGYITPEDWTKQFMRSNSVKFL